MFVIFCYFEGMMQLLTQGSADIVLDACTDFWDGDDLCELTSIDRYFHFLFSFLIFILLSSFFILMLLFSFCCFHVIVPVFVIES